MEDGEPMTNPEPQPTATTLADLYCAVEVSDDDEDDARITIGRLRSILATISTLSDRVSELEGHTIAAHNRTVGIEVERNTFREVMKNERKRAEALQAENAALVKERDKNAAGWVEAFTVAAEHQTRTTRAEAIVAAQSACIGKLEGVAANALESVRVLREALKTAQNGLISIAGLQGGYDGWQVAGTLKGIAVATLQDIPEAPTLIGENHDTR